ncbi:superfamily II DNA/RNA helicase [Bradyrhizobium sp. JR7.2]|uniref:DEAD/DEAH box helicase n=1 Tax=unclassified Bradyrhizobium TaxID=2631580 RepID=UPI0033987444
MFDPITTALIRNAPAFDGLDTEGLPKRLTHAFADIVSARIRLRAASETGEREELVETLDELRRVAAAHEAYVTLLPERENRVAAAFVAASAHQACMLGRAVDRIGSRVDVAALSPEICSSLLFLVAEAHADAAEAAKRIMPDADGANPVEAALLQAIKNLAQGNLIAVVRPEMPPLSEPDITARALQALQLLLLRGVRRLAAQLRARVDQGGAETSASIFLRCKSLCSERIDGILDTGDTVVSLYPGPLHLANLLLAVERDLLETALTRTPTPPGVPENGWWHIVRRMARHRPFLWRNHRQAIENGYLGEGISSAISFPTGGGKSTLAELKIASALLRQGKVVFLAPTHALVGQTTRSLKRTFQNFDVLGDIDEDLTFSAAVELPEVTVTTPERCLMLLSIQPDAFADLKLIVFDECHLLHPREEDRSRRGLDAMLTLLNLTKMAPDADLLLLSAMMKNTAEIASWIASLTGRDCLPLDLAWKPTRQVRGCVVYAADQIATLNAKLTQARRAHPEQGSTPAAVKRELMAHPFGLFGLLQTWSTTAREDYSLLPLLPDPQLLSTSTGRRWYLTPNGNHVSSAIAAASASAGMKTLVFLQTTVFCESCVKGFPDRISARPVTLTEEESAWRTLVVEEMGGAEYCYLQLDSDGFLKTGAASHHSLLLREERDLHESLFKRRDGIDVLFATSTLAQGMNLPSEVVIISGDSRFDPGADKMKKLEAHELLNAAGRAGRAGEGAQGFVLLVPSKVIDLDDEGNKINGHWMQLQAIFEQADQCLVIDDPLTSVLDQIQNGTTKTGTAAYLLGKLPVSIGASGENDPAAVMLNRSFAVFRAKAAGDLAWVKSRLTTALAARTKTDLPEEGKWIEQVGGATGLSVGILQEILELADKGHLDGTSLDVITALLAWLATKPIILMDMVRPESLEGLFGEKYKKLPDDKQRSVQALAAITKLLPLWMTGAPLCTIEATHLERPDRLGKCEYARHFASRVIPDLAFLAGLPAQLLMARAKSSGDTSQPLPTVLATLGGAVREGCDSPEALATKINTGRTVSRVAARKIYDNLKVYAPPGTPYEDFEITRQRMRGAEAILSFVSITPE